MAFTDLFKLYNVVFEKNPFIKDRVMDFDTFERIFVPFCRADGVNIGKTCSYYRASKCLAEYLNIPNLGNGNAYRILKKEAEINDRGSSFYQQLLRYLEIQRRSAFLRHGFLQIAMRYFAKFAADNNLL